MRLRFNLEHYLRIRNLSTRVEIILQTCIIPVLSFIVVTCGPVVVL